MNQENLQLEDVLKDIETANLMQQDWLEHGLDFVNFYVEDVEGDWLENWGEEGEYIPFWTNTAQWLQEVFEQGWESLESLLSENQLALAYTMRNRQQGVADSEAKAVKLVSLGETNLDFALLIARSLSEDGKIGVIVQLHPVGDARFLPEGLELSLLDEECNLIQEPVSSRMEDNFIQLKRFRGSEGDRFLIHTKSALIKLLSNNVKSLSKSGFGDS